MALGLIFLHIHWRVRVLSISNIIKWQIFFIGNLKKRCSAKSTKTSINNKNGLLSEHTIYAIKSRISR